MAPEADYLELVGRVADERLLGEDLSHLPASEGHPEELPLTAARRRIVAVGAALTGATLIVGSALILFGLIDLLSGGGVVAIGIGLVLGMVLVATHWGWVHVAELSATKLEGRQHASLHERRRSWLAGIAPYPRWEVRTAVGDDGAITILTVCHRPVSHGEETFTFVREETAREVHPASEPAAAVTERAELLRRQAAIDTARARERYEQARATYDAARLAAADEREHVAALKATSEALSERINTNLREPPLTE